MACGALYLVYNNAKVNRNYGLDLLQPLAGIPVSCKLSSLTLFGGQMVFQHLSEIAIAAGKPGFLATTNFSLEFLFTFVLVFFYWPKAKRCIMATCKPCHPD